MGVEHGVTGRAGVSEASKANPGRAMRTAIDASSAEFETFKETVFVRGEIGIQSSGHVNAPGVDFVTAARRTDGQMEIILNDAMINGNKKVKTVLPPKWIDEAEVAINRLDIGDTVLEEEILAIHLGTNALLTAGHVEQAREVFVHADWVVAQFKSPDPVILYAFRQARRPGKHTYLNSSLWRQIDTVAGRYPD